MNKFFKEALEAGHIEIAPGPGGKPLVVASVQYYQASDSGINLTSKQFHSFGDVLRKHDALKMNEEGFTIVMSLLQDTQRKALMTPVSEPEAAMDSIREAVTIVQRIEERWRLGFDVAQLYDVMCLWYFWEIEDPGEVDYNVNKRRLPTASTRPILRRWVYLLSRQTSYCRFILDLTVKNIITKLVKIANTIISTSMFPFSLFCLGLALGL